MNDLNGNGTIGHTISASSSAPAENEFGPNNEEESLALKSIFGDGTSDFSVVREFFQSTYQKQCADFRWENRQKLLSEEANKKKSTSSGWNEEHVKQSPYEEIIHQGWEVLVQLLIEAGSDASRRENEVAAPLIFKDLESVTDQFSTLYNNNVFAAYLDGCSVVFNHADWSSPWIAALCLDLQNSFPHAYANTYLTPPHSQAVHAHADDRDVIVIQVVGSKQWKVYQKVPIPFCYPHEQVGKEGLEVPAEVLNGPVLRETILRPGDVLYLPRGYVHEAKATENEPSFHVTIALATHDWTLAGTLSKATDKILSSVFPFRMAMDRRIGTRELRDIPEEVKHQLQLQIGEAFRLVQEEVNVESVARNQETKLRNHNNRALEQRMSIIRKIKQSSLQELDGDIALVGPQTARFVEKDTYIRAATDEEKASVMMDKPRGLQVREQTADAIISILQSLRAQPSLQCKVKYLKTLLAETEQNTDYLCDLTLLSFAKICVEQGALAVIH